MAIATTINPAMFAPSEYSALIVRHLVGNPDAARGKSVCDVGTGSGLLAQTALELGAAHAVATDIDPDALAVAREALAASAAPQQWDVRLGSIWDAIGKDEAFDLVLANLPNFPSNTFTPGQRSRHWAAGGADGRRFVEPFLAELPERLTPGGRAIFTQNRCIGLTPTLDALTDANLNTHVHERALIAMSAEKSAALDPGAAGNAGFVRIGTHVFLEVCLILAEKP